MANTVRQNFILPKTLKKELDKMVPKGQQSAFVAESINVRLKSKKSWEALNIPALLDISHSVRHVKKLRKQWERRSA